MVIIRQALQKDYTAIKNLIKSDPKRLMQNLLPKFSDRMRRPHFIIFIFMDTQQLNAIAKAMVAKGKGILAIDESSSTCKKRFDAIGVECTEENRRKYRQLLVSAQVAPGTVLDPAGLPAEEVVLLVVE
jgi:hypothetical protein